MNFLSKNPKTGEFYLSGVYKLMDGSYKITSIYLHSCGSLRTAGDIHFTETKLGAIRYCEKLHRTKAKMKGFISVGLEQLPENGRQHLKLDVDTYVSQEEMLRIVAEALREHYVKFDCVIGLEDRFDEDLEYLAIRDVDDEDLYDVYDRNGVLYMCNKYLFSSIVPTERAKSVSTTSDKTDDYCKS